MTGKPRFEKQVGVTFATAVLTLLAFR